MLAIGAVGLVASLLGGVIGYRLVSQVDHSISSSLTLTAETLGTVESSLDVAEDTLTVVDRGLDRAEETASTLTSAFADGEEVLRSAAELTGSDLADSLAAVEQTMPALEQAASAIDRTLATLSALPLGIGYDPDQPFDTSIREIRESLDGVPDELREQGALMAEAGESLGEVGQGTAEVATDLAEIQSGLDEALVLMRSYADTASGASTLVDQSQQDLALQMRLARATVVGLALVFALGQFVPLYFGWALRAGGVVVPPPTVGPRP